MVRSILPLALTGALLVTLIAAGPKGSASNFASVNQARLDAADQDADNWLNYGHGYSEQRYSTLEQINESTVGGLSLAWSAELDTSRGQEATPIVVDGVMYTSTAMSKVVALDAATGRVLWRFDPEVDGTQASRACCDFVNRGVAVWKGRVFIGTIDGRLIALNARTGAKVWDVLTIDKSKPYTITMAPRVVRDKIIIGNSGAELGVRGYVSAYDTNSGKLVWRFYTVPGDPSKGPDGAASDDILEKLARPTWFGENYWKLGGGGTVWDSIVYDKELNQLIIGVGNGSPWDHKWRSAGKGDNLFLSSMLALDPDTGKYKWHYQVNPGESWDYTATQQIMLADLQIDGKMRKVAMQAPKNGFFYVVDRSNGKLISAQPFVKQTWAERIDLATGRPVEIGDIRREKGPSGITPSGLGGHNWTPMSYSPKTGLVYIPAIESSTYYVDAKPFEIHPGRWNTGVGFGAPPPSAGAPAQAPGAPAKLLAWDPVAQKARWVVERDWSWNGGTLATAGNLVFQGTVRGALEAYSADKGKKLWSYQTRHGLIAAPMTFRVKGQQYVAIMAGFGGVSGVGGTPPFISGKPPYGMVLAFKLGGKAKLPASTSVPLDTPTPSSETFTPQQIATGTKFYFEYCMICHGGTVNPVLPRSAYIADKAAFQQVVLGGALARNGMASFSEHLTPDDAEGIRAFLNVQAKALLEAEKGKAPAR